MTSPTDHEPVADAIANGSRNIASNSSRDRDRDNYPGETSHHVVALVTREPADGMMPEGNATTTTRPHLTVVDSPMRCSTIRCQDLGDDQPLADVLVAWINERELGPWRGTLCFPCYKAGTQIMVDCPRGAIWYIVRFLR